MERPIIRINEEKCNGCGQCITDCAEGALAIVNGKARLISEVYCDGLGACLDCPQGALELGIREAPPFDEKAAMTAKAAREKNSMSMPQTLKELRPSDNQPRLRSSLRSWPIQLALMPAQASFLENAHVLLSAHCSGFALPDLQKDWLNGRVPIIACPKLEDTAMLAEKLARVLEENSIASLTLLRMSVPCCGGLTVLAQKACEMAKCDVRPQTYIIQV